MKITTVEHSQKLQNKIMKKVSIVKNLMLNFQRHISYLDNGK